MIDDELDNVDGFEEEEIIDDEPLLDAEESEEEAGVDEIISDGRAWVDMEGNLDYGQFDDPTDEFDKLSNEDVDRGEDE